MKETIWTEICTINKYSFEIESERTSNQQSYEFRALDEANDIEFVINLEADRDNFVCTYLVNRTAKSTVEQFDYFSLYVHILLFVQNHKERWLES